jgi:hypothetical protein
VKKIFLLAASLFFVAYSYAQIPESEPNNDFLTANNILPVQAISGTINSANYDYFATKLPTDGKLRIIIQATNTHTGNAYLYLRVYDKRQAGGQILEKYVAYNIGVGTTAFDTTVINARAADSMYFRLETTENFNYQIKYQLEDVTTNDVEPANSFETALPIVENQTKQGHIGYRLNGTYDRKDYYKTYLQNDGSFKLMVKAKNVWQGNGYLYLRVYDGRNAAGQILEKHIAYNTSSTTITFDTTIIKVRARDSIYFTLETDEAFDYDVKYTITDIPAYDVEPNNSFEDAIIIAENQTKLGHLSYRYNGTYDRKDYYKTYLQNDGSFKLMITAKNVWPGNAYLYLRVYDGRKGSGQILEKHIAYNTAPTTITFDTTLIKVLAKDSIYFTLETDEAFDYDVKYLITDIPIYDVEPNNSFDEAVAITETQNKQGHIGYRTNGGYDQLDYYKSLIPKDGAIKIMVKAKNVWPGNAYLYMRVYDGRKAAGEIFNKYNAYNIASGTTIYDTSIIKGIAIDSLFFRLETNEAFDYEIKYQMVDTSINDAEPNNSFATAINVNSGIPKYGHLAYRASGTQDNQDYYKTIFGTTDSLKLYIQATNKNGGNGYVYLRIYNKLYNQILEKYVCYNVGDNSISIDSTKFLVTAPDTIYWRLEGNESFSYNLSIGAKLPNGDFSITGNTSACPGSTIYKTSGVTETGLIWHWALSGGGSVSFVDSIATVNWTTSGTYILSCYVSNSIGNSEIKYYTVIVNSGPPTSAPVITNTARTLQANTAAVGATYQWYKNNILISAATDSSYYAADAGTFTCKFINGCGASAASNSFNFATAVLAQTISFPHVADITMSPTAFAKLNATASSGLTVSYQIVSGPGTISNDTVRVSGFGTVIVKALQNGNNTYAPAPTKNDTINVVKGNQTISFTTIPNKIFSNVPFALDATASSGLPITYTIVSGNASINGYLLTMLGAGAVQVKASQAGNTSYNAAPDSIANFCIGIRQLDAIVGEKNVCPTAVNYSTKNIAGAIYEWSISGGGILTPNGYQASVQWQTPGAYTLKVKAYTLCDTIRTTLQTVNITVTPATAPDVVTNMLPANNTTGLNLPLNLSWIPGTNTNKFDLYLWPTSQVQPLVPIASNIVDINYTVNNEIALGTNYSWQVVSKNECLSTTSSIKNFTASTNSAAYPDLVMDSISFNSNAIQGQQITVSWRVKNIGMNSTNNVTWKDRIYISTSKDLRLGFFPPLIGEFNNQSYLQPGQSYTQTQTVTIPQGLTGSYYLFVIADNVDAVCDGVGCDIEWGPRGNHGSNLAEANEYNNYKYNYLIIDYGELADLKVKTMAAPTNVFNATPFNITYSVKNEGVVNAIGQTINTCPQAGWFDKFYLSQSPIFDAGTAYSLPQKAIQFFKNGEANCTTETLPYIDYLKPDSTYFAIQQITVPHNLFGTYYLYVHTNGTGNLYEGPYSTNNIKRSDAINVTPTPPADLLVTNIVNPPTTLSGNYAKIKWMVSNQGLNAPKEFSWSDSVFICSSSTFNTANVIAKGSIIHNSGTLLNSGGSYTDSVSVFIPNGISGNYYVYVKTDASFQVFEYTMENNNLLRSTATFTIQLAPVVDLVVTRIETPDSLRIDSAFTFAYSIKNQGAGNIASISSLTDNIYVSLDSSLTGTKIFLYTQGHTSTVLNAGDTLKTTVQLTISPNGGFENKKLYFFVTTDASNTIYEHNAENNNQKSSTPPIGRGYTYAKPVIIPYTDPRKPDLKMFSITAPSNKNSGDTFAVTYTVKNQGSVATLATTWFDGIYLSNDTLLDVNDVNLKEFPISSYANNGLKKDSIYSRTGNIILPINITGAKFLLFKTGYVINDSITANNIKYAAINIAASPTPDLIVTAMSNPPVNVYSGSQFMIYYSIQNSGAGKTNGDGVWFDGAYFSSNTFINGGSQAGSSTHTGHLTATSSYTDSILIHVPSYLSGNYYLILRTDNSDGVYEGATGNNNNAVYKVVNIIQNPISTDLIVSNLAVPDSFTLGKTLTSTLKIKNIGANPAVGSLANALYLSQNNIYESGIDKLVNSKEITSLVLNAGDSISTQISGRAIVNTTGNYTAIARTNILNSINEGSNTNNNTLASSNLINIEATNLTINVSKIDTVELNNARYFRVTTTANKDVQITVNTSISSNGTNAVLVAYNRVPTALDYDASGIDATTLNQKVLISDTKAGVYYIRISTSGVSVNEPITILVQELPFSIVSISPNALGKNIVTTKLLGAGFKTNSQIVLRNSVGTLISTGVIKKFENSTKILVGWNFTNTPSGTYNLVVINPGGIEVVKTNAITITYSSGYQLKYTQLLPENLRLNGTGILTFRGKNTGNIDIPVIQGDFSVERYVNVTNIRAVGIRKQSEFFKGNSYADYITNKSDSLDWVFNNGLKTVPVFGRNIAPGDEFEVSFNVSGFTGSDFLIQPRLYGYNANLLARTQLEFIETARILCQFDSALLSNPNSRYLQLAQSGTKPFSDTVFAALFKSGFMEAADTVGMNINYACSRCMRNLPAVRPGFTSTSDTTIDQSDNEYNAVIDHDFNILPGQTMQVRMKKSHYWPGYNKVKGAAGTAMGWNKIHVNGKIDIQATTANRLKIDLASITYKNAPGRLAGWYPAADTNWIIIEADSGITNFSSNKFIVDNFKFTTFNNIYNGQFRVAASDSINGLPTKLRLVFIAYKPQAGEPGVPGVDGVNGEAPLYVDGEAGSPAGKGGIGAKGGKGGRGGNGVSGGNGGKGGRGGDGGINGGDGGQGGAGGDGGPAGSSGDNGGNGGDAGEGGDAGAGATACKGGDGNNGGNGKKGDTGGTGGNGSNGGVGNAGGADGIGGNGGAGGPGSGGDGQFGNFGTGPLGGVGGIGGPPDPCKKKQPGGPSANPGNDPSSKDALNDFFDALKSFYPGTSFPAAILNAMDIDVKADAHPGLNLLVKGADLFVTGVEVAAASTFTTITVVGGSSVLLVEAPLVATSFLIVKTYNVAARAADYGISKLVGGNGDYFGKGFVKDFIWTTDFATSPADILAGTAKFFFGNNQPPGPPPTPTPTAIPIKRPCDPNEIIGTSGYGSSRMVSVNETLPYSIHFENDSLHASVAAQRVVVRQPIHAKADPLTFRLADFNFGGHTFNVPQNQSTYFTVLDFDSLGYKVEVTAGIDIVNREAFWVFQTIDAQIGLPPVNPLLGFLPINDANGKGTGFVNYTIKPLSTNITGDSITAKASIVFDINDPIPTNTWTNIIDAVAPISSITDLPATTYNTFIDLHLTGTDDAGGSGLKSYDLYVTDNGSAPITWVTNFTKTDTSFEGNIGHTYAFYAIAKDNVGNVENYKYLDSIKILSSNQVNLCPNTSTVFPANKIGTTYQWQLDTGSGFVDISNSAVYGGTNTANLAITNAPSSLSGNAYRCRINSSTFSQVYTLKFEMTWEGTISNVWSNAANWSCGTLPDAGTDVIINTGKTNYPQVNSNVIIRSLKLNTGTSASVLAGFNLKVLK